MSDQQILRDELFHLTMQQKWDSVVEIYHKDSNAHGIRLTESVGTAFHIAISSYNSKRPNPTHERCTVEMLSLMNDRRSLYDMLKMPNMRGDTPLHLAAAVGWEALCTKIASRDPNLIEIRNGNGETPLFVAAHRGNLKTFLSLHSIYYEGKGNASESLICRRKDGNTILHSAIAGEYFKLVHFIMEHYRYLLNYVNVVGKTPLHVLAGKPNLFKSSSHLGFYESIIYRCLFVDDDLKKLPKPNPNAIRDVLTKEKFPENYRTCVDIVNLLWSPIYKSFQAGLLRCEKKNGIPSDVEDQPYEEHGVPINESFLAGCSRSKKRNVAPANGNEEISTKYFGSFPPNNTTCIAIFKLPIKVFLMLGIEFLKIRKIHEKKVRHAHGMEIMKKMMEFQPSYKYDSNGQRPVHLPDELSDILNSIPSFEEDDDGLRPQILQAYSRPTSLVRDQQKHDNNIKYQKQAAGNDGVKGDTPLLVAAKTGILEMVEEILNAVPGAIQDLDSQGRNALMVAAQNRQISVFDSLLQRNIPDYVFLHADNHGDSILHHAAKLGEKQPWRIPGAALQMQWEILWYKHVKKSVPSPCFTHYNAKGESPRTIFTHTHENLVLTGNAWLITTSESCSVVAALIATVAFATSATVPGGLEQQHGHPLLQDHKAFDIFSVASPIALCVEC